MRFILGGIRPIATISQSQNKNNELFANFLRLGDSSSLSQSGKEPQYSHFAVLSGLNLRSGELATIPNRKNVAIRSDFLFWTYGPASGRCWGGGVPDRSLDYRRMLWFRIRVVPWLAQALFDLACAPNLEFDLLIFSLVLFYLRSDFGVCADSRIRTALWCGMRVLIFWCAIIAGHIISFERLVHG